MVSFFVRYETVGDVADLRAYYRDHHVAILERFPGIRQIVLHEAKKFDDPFPTTPGPTTWMAQMIFDTLEDLNAALQSTARADARTDFARFPPFEGKVVHEAYVSSQVFAQ